MNPSPGTSSHFTRAKAIMGSLSGPSKLKILLATLASSRPGLRPLAHGLLRLMAPGTRISYRYKIGNCKRIGFLRWEHLDSDLQSALELAVGDAYRLEHLPQPDFIIDGGANIGLFSLAAAARWPAVPIIAFEPVPANLDAIRSHLDANHAGALVKVEAAALAGADGSSRFFVREANQGSFSALQPGDRPIDVDCRALAQYLPSDPRKFKLVKLDIEGAEVEVLDALFSNGRLSRILILMELHNTPVTRPWIEQLADRIGFDLEFFEIGSATAHCQLSSPDLRAA